ncbi:MULTISPECIES: hypothetical protein [Bradyrhizobium]|uniref:hypothetical protein n=1 Tax=Bradyrhizobium TaxID=374 RepID=UPI002897CA4C|nr:hypothetical protein [Bradyrhizobium altum]
MPELREVFNPACEGPKPIGNCVRAFKTLLREIVTVTEINHPAFPFICAELEWRERERSYVREKNLLFVTRDEFGFVAQPGRSGGL